MGGPGSGKNMGMEHRKRIRARYDKLGGLSFDEIARKYNEENPFIFTPTAAEDMLGRISCLTKKDKK